MKKSECLRKFAAQFGTDSGARAFFAPGRVNLIGEHIDYNGGHVFPCALSIGTYAAVRRRDDGKIRYYSENFPQLGVIEHSLDTLDACARTDWTAYPNGVVWVLKKTGHSLKTGFDMWVSGNIPNGAGLSSSASLEVVTGFALNRLFELGLSNRCLALIGQQAENEYVGMNCGIMDQFAIAMGKAGCAVFLNTETLEYAYAPLELQGYEILIMDTRKKRGLKDSKYNERRGECEAALAALQESLPLKALCGATETQLETHREKLTDAQFRRARHAVTEDIRTRAAYDALCQGDLTAFGELMNASHRSLETDYEVTGKELDSLVHAAWQTEGVLGARMTGAGFGGCAVAIVRTGCAEDIQARVAARYKQETGLDAAFYIASVGGGPAELED